MHKYYFNLLLFFLFLKTIAMVFVILYAGIGLGPDEAQYWTWSQQLDWGYYSKPPGIAWQNGVGTYLFGNTELGLRSMALLISFIVPMLIYAMAKAFHSVPPTCFWASMAMAFSPLGVMSSLLSITDGGMILFWTASCVYMAREIERNETPNYLFLGILIFAGALFKWPMYLFWILILGIWRLYPRMISWRIVIGLAISLLALMPSVYWNASHDWVTFRHVWATITGGHSSKVVGARTSGNFFEYLGAQILLVSPILFVLFLIGLWKLFFEKNFSTKSRGLTFCGLISLVVLGFTSSVSLFMKMQGNWGIFAYPTAFVVIGWYACEMSQAAKKWLIGGIVLSVLLCSFALMIPYQQSNQVLSLSIPYKFNPFRHNVGWEALQHELKAAGYNPQKDFLFADKYQTASILSFYGQDKKRAYFLNISRARKNQFSFWPGMDIERKGQRGFFVVVENAPKLNTDSSEIINGYQKLLKPYFEHVRFLGIKPLFYANGQMAKGAFIFECTGYSGNTPTDPALF